MYKITKDTLLSTYIYFRKSPLFFRKTFFYKVNKKKVYNIPTF